MVILSKIKIGTGLLKAVLALSLVCLAASLSIHLWSYTLQDEPSVLILPFFLYHAVLFVVWFTTMFAYQQRYGNKFRMRVLFEASPVVLTSLYWILSAYFLVFLFGPLFLTIVPWGSAGLPGFLAEWERILGLDSGDPPLLRLFSGVWIVLYYAAAAGLYSELLRRRPADGEIPR